jgi:hypothetical protein
VQEGFGRDTATVQTGAAQLVFFNKCNAFSKLRRSKSSCIAATSATKDYNVKVVVSQLDSPQNFVNTFKLYY